MVKYEVQAEPWGPTHLMDSSDSSELDKLYAIKEKYNKW